MSKKEGRRLTIGSSGLALVFLLLGSMTSWEGIQGATNDAEIQQGSLQVSVYSGAESPVRVRIETREGQHLFAEQLIQPGQLIHFSLERARCNHPLQAWVNERHYPAVQGNFCPENYPDEIKTLVILPTGVPQVIGEDRD